MMTDHRATAIVALLLSTGISGCGDFLTDGATRLAYELEAGAKKVSGSGRTTLEHRPKATPDGCAGAYKLQLSANAGLVIWCKDANGKTVSSHITTHHLRFVDVPQTWIVDKVAGTPTFIELEKRGGKPVVTAVR
ncbi:MAG: hypothetical protein ACREUW_16890 [Burkholderiales bacterium]